MLKTRPRRQRHIRGLGLVALALALIAGAACTAYDEDRPDTQANRAGFERHLHRPVPASVSDLYYYADELGADVVYQLGFQADPTTVADIVTELGLVQRPADIRIGLARAFDWWDADRIADLTPYWKHNEADDYAWYLWYDPDLQRVYYLEFSW